jgi:hypothetical protein
MSCIYDSGGEKGYYDRRVQCREGAGSPYELEIGKGNQDSTNKDVHEKRE